MWYIYKYTNKINSHMYIGLTNNPKNDMLIIKKQVLTLMTKTIIIQYIRLYENMG